MSSSYAHRFVGRESTPSRLSDFDIEQFFRLSAEDVSAVCSHFRAEHRAPAALILLFLRASGRPLDRFTVLPRNLLRYVGEAFKTSSPTIASLRSIYQRSQTLYVHLGWVKRHLGIRDLEARDEVDLAAMLQLRASEASHPDDLATDACHWLYERRILIPGPRRVRDWAREAFSAVETEILRTITVAISKADLKRCHQSAYSTRSGDTANHLEWLKTPPRRHGPSTLSETLAKVRYLKSLSVHEWPLDAIALSKQRAYAQQVQGRRPAKTRELKDTTLTIELVCFLRMSLLELTDLAVQQGSRRSQYLFRNATTKAQAGRERSDQPARAVSAQAREVLRDESKDWRIRCLEAEALLSAFLDAPAATFLSQVRKALVADYPRVVAFLGGFRELEFGGAPTDPGFAQWTAWRELQAAKTTELPADFVSPKVGKAWHDLVHDADRQQGLKAFAACTMMSMRKSLRSGKLWIDHSFSFRARDRMLIPSDEWERDRSKYSAMLGLPATADTFLEPLLANLKAGLAAVSEACDKGKLGIGSDGMLHLPESPADPGAAEPKRTLSRIFQLIGDVQFPDILLDVDADCGYTEALLGHRAENADELLAMYAALLAHGTDIEAKSVAAMIPGMETARVSIAMRALETHGRLRRANQRVAVFQGRIPLAAHWGNGEKASADMMSLDVSRHLWSARVDPRRRTYAAGIYTHVLDRWGIVYDQPIVLNERQAGVAIEGVEQHNRSEDRIRLSLLAVDTHGYTNPAMAVAKLLGFDLCPRLRDLAERKLYLPVRFTVPENIERITLQRVSLKAIRAGWDDLMRVIASVRIGKIGADLALRLLSSAAKGDPAYKAADHLGRLLRSNFLCDYACIEDFRREIRTLLSRGESVHQLQRVVYAGKVPTDRGRRRDEMTAISGSHALLTNIVLAWNTRHMNDVVERLRKDRITIDDSWLRRMGPAHFSHINFRGTFRFGIDRYADALLQRPPASRPSAAAMR